MTDLLRPLTQADIDHLKHMRDLLVASDHTHWATKDAEDWEVQPTMDRLLRYWAHKLANGNFDVFEVEALQVGNKWVSLADGAAEMFYAYLNEVRDGKGS